MAWKTSKGLTKYKKTRQTKEIPSHFEESKGGKETDYVGQSIKLNRAGEGGGGFTNQGTTNNPNRKKKRGKTDRHFWLKEGGESRVRGVRGGGGGRVNRSLLLKKTPVQ